MVPSVMLSPISGTGTIMSVADANARRLPTRGAKAGIAATAGRCQQKNSIKAPKRPDEKNEFRHGALINRFGTG
jgi:hypothetical protein